VATLHALGENGDRALDIGANIGLTALALSQFCEKVVAIEPVPRTFEYLQCNTRTIPSISVFQHALGNSTGMIPMQGHNNFLAGSFVADAYHVETDHFMEHVPIKRLDDCFSNFGLSVIDLMKIDVEGFELEVIEGGRQIINDLKPLVFLEMNHWCLNVFRRISIPEFRERLLAIFPCVYAVDGDDFLDYGDDANVHHINHSHVVHFKFCNLIAGFDRDEITERLMSKRSVNAERTICAPEAELSLDNLQDGQGEISQLKAKIQELQEMNQAYEASKSWRITAPLRDIYRLLKR
jgi:FkbM family methyltransferase